MALQWFDSDGTTPYSGLNLGTVGPGETYAGKHAGAAAKLVLKNAGASDAEDVLVTIKAVSDFAAAGYVRIATGPTQPASNQFVDIDTPLVVGTIGDGDSVNVWVDVDVPPAELRRRGQLFTLQASSPTGA